MNGRRQTGRLWLAVLLLAFPGCAVDLFPLYRNVEDGDSSEFSVTHDKLKGPALSSDPQTGETHLRHHVGADGYYRGKKIIESPADDIE